jgi:hypothetical protein
MSKDYVDLPEPVSALCRLGTVLSSGLVPPSAFEIDDILEFRNEPAFGAAEDQWIGHESDP